MPVGLLVKAVATVITGLFTDILFQEMKGTLEGV
jgi:hypothetical protein